MANKKHLKILKQGVDTWNAWRKQHPKSKPNLAGADLSSANLKHVDFSRTNLSTANLQNADLTRADLSGTRLTRAELNAATLNFATFFGTNLIGANLLEAFLGLAKFYRAIVGDANFTHCWIAFTTFAETDLSEAKGLDTVNHAGSSTIGIDTLYLSKGKIPEVFLRGCGVPEEMIEFSRSLIGRPIEFNSCFISYSTKDETFAQRLYNDLQANGVRCWFAPHDMKGGSKLHDQIDWAIHYHDRVLLLLSPDSINSEWVRREIDKARKKEAKENRDVLFPISLVSYNALRDWEYIDADTGKDVAKEIRSFFIPDFSNWKDHDSYQVAFKKLLEDLKGERCTAESA